MYLISSKTRKGPEGNFKESLIGDSLGMLALYEATHLMVDGEEILEEEGFHYHPSSVHGN